MICPRLLPGAFPAPAAAMHAYPLAVHGLQFRLDREDENLDVGQGVPAVATAGAGNTAVGRRRQVDTTA